MAKRKCPACGSSNVVKIFYGYPGAELFQSYERGEIKLGGCCIEINSPSLSCKNCGTDFGGKHFKEYDNMTSFEFFVGSFGGPSHYIYIDGCLEEKKLRYGYSEFGMIINLKDSDCYNDCKGVSVKEVHLNNSKWSSFIDKLSKLEISSWRDNYYNNDICDGTQWNLDIEIGKIKKINKSGSNEFPPYWSKFLKLLRETVGEKI